MTRCNRCGERVYPWESSHLCACGETTHKVCRTQCCDTGKAHEREKHLARIASKPAGTRGAYYVKLGRGR